LGPSIGGLYFGVARGVFCFETTAFLGKGNPMRRIALAFLASLLVLIGASTALAIPVARLQLWSDPGDYVGEGGTYDFIYDRALGDRAGAVTPLYPQVDQLILLLDGPPGSGHKTALLQLGTRALGIPLQPGYYPNTSGYVENGPVLIVSLRDRIAFDLAGEFTIFDFAFSSGSLTRLVVEFTQYANGSSAALRGRLDYDADGLTNIPEPSTALLMLLGLTGLSCRRLAV